MNRRKSLRNPKSVRATRAGGTRRELGHPDLGQPWVRGLIAESVHRTLCDFSGSDGCGHCMLYAVAGMAILGQVFDRKIYPQAGSLGVLVEPPDRWLVMDAENFSAGE